MIQLTGLDKYLQAHLNSATLTLVITGCKKIQQTSCIYRLEYTPEIQEPVQE